MREERVQLLARVTLDPDVDLMRTWPLGGMHTRAVGTTTRISI